MKRFLLISILFLSLGLSAQICSNKLIFSATTDTTLYKSIGITNEVQEVFLFIIPAICSLLISLPFLQGQ